MAKALRLHQRFTADEWFSSLWTLQEAFLGPKAIVMYRDGLPPSILDATCDGGGNIAPTRLDMFAQVWYSISSTAFSFRKYTESEELIEAIDRVGFLDGVRNQSLTFALEDLEYPLGSMGNPFKLLVASKHGTTRYDDRVYGIMQVFDLHLGKYAPGASAEDFSWDELRTQLAAAVLS